MSASHVPGVAIEILLLLAVINTVCGKSVVVTRRGASVAMPTLPFPNSVFQHKVRSHQTDGTFVLFEAEYLNGGPGHHLHTRDDELFHILQGQVQFIVNNTQFCAATGDYVYVPRNVSQGIRVQNPNNGTAPVKLQIMLLPSKLDHFLDEIVLLYNRDRTNQSAVNLISDKYGIVNLPAVQWEELGCFDATST